MPLSRFLKKMPLRQKINRNYEYLHHVINFLAEGIVVTDEEGTVIFLNQQAPKILHRSEKTLLNQPLCQIFEDSKTIKGKQYRADTKPHRSFCAFLKEHVYSQHKDVLNEDFLYRYRGREYILSVNINPIIQSGKLEAVVFSFRDVTERRMKEENQVRFARIMGHELKHPLASIKAYVHFLRKLSDSSNKRVSSYLDKTDQQVNMLVKMINDLLDISKISANRFAVDPRQLDVAKCVADTVSDLQPVHQHHKLVLEAQRPVLAEIDELRLRQVVTNLISNAIKYSSDAKQVKITVQQEQDRAVISVQDQGPGIEQDKLDAIFSPYTRLKTTQAKKVKGLGLGLYIAKTIVEKHQGEIVVESKVGKGSTFRVFLPTTAQ